MNWRNTVLYVIAAQLLILFIVHTIYMNKMRQYQVEINQQGPKQRHETNQTKDITRVIEQIRNSTSSKNETHPQGKCKLSFNCAKGSNPPFEPSMKNVTFADLRLQFPDIKLGGSWSPDDCDPGQKVAIILPYRDREEHLKFLLANIIPFLKLQKRVFTIFVIEQAGNALFNRACLLNIGYIEALKLDRYTCFIFHDVDMVPVRLCNLYECYADKALHLGVSRNFKPPRNLYTNYIGGVLALDKRQMEKINGFSNIIFGWGKEDDESFLRLKKEKITVTHRTPKIGDYVMPKHDRDKTNPFAPRGRNIIPLNANNRKADGLNSLNYTFKEIVQDPLYTKIVVDIEGPQTIDDVSSYYAQALEKVKQRLRST